MEPMQKKRPGGVTVLAVLQLLLGVFSLSGGLLALAGGALLGFTGLVLLSAIAQAFGVVLVIFGLVWLVVGYGTWTGKGWAWWLAVIFAVLGILGGLVGLLLGTSGSVLGLLLDLIILYYLTRPQVKAFFGRGRPASQMTPGTTQPPS